MHFRLLRAAQVAAVVAALVSGCGGGGDDDGFRCSIDALTGTWRVEFTETSGGTCGPIPSRLVNGGAIVAPPGCTTTFEQVSADRCQTQETFSCVDPDTGATFTASGTARQQSATRVTGTLTLTVEGVCSSVYNLTSTRQ